MTDENFKLVITKGIYPYEYMNNFDKFNETQLPDIKCFYSSHNDETVIEEQYKYAKKVWETFKIKNMGEYHDFYLKTDVMLLSDVFENYRDLDLKTYNVDPARYLTAPSFSLDVALKNMEKKLNFSIIQKNMKICITS